MRKAVRSEDFQTGYSSTSLKGRRRWCGYCDVHEKPSNLLRFFVGVNTFQFWGRGQLQVDLELWSPIPFSSVWSRINLIECWDLNQRSFFFHLHRFRCGNRDVAQPPRGPKAPWCSALTTSRSTPPVPTQSGHEDYDTTDRASSAYKKEPEALILTQHYKDRFAKAFTGFFPRSSQRGGEGV